jgi:cysteine synthase A
MADYTPSLQTTGRGKVYENLTETIGNTPLVKIPKVAAKHGAKGTIMVKLEFFNPLSSVKDRLALALVESAEQSGKVKPGSTLVEVTSGNTGIGLAFICAAKGYKLVLFMPESMSDERKKMLRYLGADLQCTPAPKGLKGSFDACAEYLEKNPEAVYVDQFKNQANPTIHKYTTGPEIWNDTEGKVDILVLGVGTGGTLTGAGQYLKSKNPNLKIFAVEPSGSPVLSGGKPGPHKIQGIGAGFVPDVLDKALIDEVIQVQEADAFSTALELAHLEGIPGGISSGAIVKAATVVAARPESEGKNIVTIMPSCAERYISTALFENI